MLAISSAVVFLEIVWSCSALKMVMLDVPSPAIVGESVELTCSYDLDGDKLYSVKWYKNGTEFYRFVPNDWPPGQFLPLPGVKIELSKSNSKAIYLTKIDLNSSGIYRCEVSAESPYFQTVESEREMNVIMLPTEGPKIFGGQQKYFVGDTVSLNCESAKSKPAPTLQWFINEEEIGPECETKYSTTLHADGLETSSLTLKFLADEKHFRGGNMKLKCTASVSRFSVMSDEEMFHGGNLQSSLLHVNEADETDHRHHTQESREKSGKTTFREAQIKYASSSGVTLPSYIWIWAFFTIYLHHYIT